MTDLAAIRHVALDLDGTLYRSGKLFAATKPFLATLARLGVGYTFLTNNTSLSQADYVTKLGKLGLDANEGNVRTPAASVILHLRDTLKVKRLSLLGTPSLAAEFERAGFAITDDAPEAVVVAFDITLDYAKLCRTAYWIAQGLPFVATHPDKVCPTDEPTVLVDCGSICAALTAATGKTPTVFGKPDPSMLREIITRHNLKPSEMAMVGDRIYTDVAMAKAAGSLAVLVLSGEATAVDAATSNADLVVNDVGELGEKIHLAQNRKDAKD